MRNLSIATTLSNLVIATIASASNLSIATGYLPCSTVSLLELQLAFKVCSLHLIALCCGVFAFI